MQTLFVVKAFFSYGVSFLVTFYCIPLFITIAGRYNILDNPDGRIKKHKDPTPYLGGLAVYIGFIATLGLIFPFYNQMFNFIIGITLLLFTGFIDDLVPLRPSQKFFGQIVAALCFMKAGLLLKESFFLQNPWIRVPLSMLWVLTVINAYNLVDIMDGLATTLALCATTSFLVIALYGLAQPEVALLLLTFMGPLTAFLWYNKPQARMYLGDTGSLFIGGFLAIVPFLFDWGTYNGYGYFSPIIILAIPLIEVGTLILVRTYKKIPFYHGSPDHFAIYLKQNGWTVPEILCYVSLMSLWLCLSAFFLCTTANSAHNVMISGFIFILTWFFILFYKRTPRN